MRPSLANDSSSVIAPSRDRAWCLGAVAILGAFYLLLCNGFWCPGPDTPFYIGIARNLALKNLSLRQGYFFNGGFVARTPPGWPLMLAAAMKISASFLFLNLVPLACMLVAAGAWYRILRRFTTPFRSFLIVILSGIGFHWYSASCQLRSEAMFAAAMAGAMLVAFQISEGKRQWWRIVLLLLLCFVMVQARYAGMPAWAVIGAILISGRKDFAPDRQWLTLLLSLAVITGTFFGTRYVLAKVLPPRVVKSEGDVQPAWADEGGEDGPAMVAVTSSRGLSFYAHNTATGGQWMAGLLWMPAQVAVSSRLLAFAVIGFGWLIIAIFAVTLVRQAMQCQWLLIGVTLYSAAIIARWGSPNPRYLMPVAPAIILGIWLGLEYLANAARQRWLAKAIAACIPLFIASLIICNLALFAVDAYIARSADFYRRYMSGEVYDLIACANYLNRLPIKSAEIAVNENYVNLSRVRPNGLGVRGLYMLTGKTITVVPTKGTANKRKGSGKFGTKKASSVKVQLLEMIDHIAKTGGGTPNEAVADYATFRHIRYYAYRPPVSPWRAWHFRMKWLQERVEKRTDIPENPGWELYELQDGHWTKIDLTPIPTWPTRVPGL